MNAALGGTLAACAWGSADFIARFTGGALGHVKALFGMLVTSAVVLTAIVLVAGVPLPGMQPGWWLVVATGVGLTVATLLLYLALVRGPVTVAAPVAGTFPAFNIVLALFLGMRPSTVEWSAMAAVMAGVFVVARAARHYEDRGHFSRAHVRRTIIVSLAASVGFAVTVAAGQEAAIRYGELPAVCYARWVSLACCALLLVARREVPRIPLRWWPALAAQGTLDGGALLAVVAASQGAASAVTAVLASCFSAVTVLLARVFIREAMTPAQWLGIVLILAGVATLSGFRA